MLRTTRIPIAWLAASALLTAAARADEPAAWPVLPITTSASIAEAPSKASQISYQEDIAGDVDSDNSSDAPTAPPSVTGNNGSSSPSSCGNCCPSVGSCCSECLSQCRGRCLTPFVGVEAAFLAPVMNHGGGGGTYNFNNSVTTGGNTTTINNYNYNTSSVNGMVVTPRLWMGLMGPCWGVGVRYWRFANGNGDPGQVPGANDGLGTQSYLRLQTMDLEAIRRIPCCGRCLWFSAGVRYGQFTRNTSFSGSELQGSSLFQSSGFASSGFNGVGPTFGLYGLHQVNCCSNWNWFYGGRVSVLFDGSGSASANATSAVVTPNVGGFNTTNGSAGSGNANAFIGEFSLGAQYNHALQCVPGIAFFRIAGEYQYWHVNNTSAFGNTSAPVSFTTGGSTFTSTTTGATNIGNSTLALLGFGISCGFMW